MSEVRRVVTTHAADGRAVVLSDEIAGNTRVRAQTGVRSTLLWTTDRTPAGLSDEDKGAVVMGTSPPPNGSVFRIVEFPPYKESSAGDRDAIIAEMGIAGHDAGGRRAPSHELMHATDSVDFALVLDGEIDMLLDDSEVHFKAGDMLVQQGTNHAWVNRGSVPCRIAFVLIGAEKVAL